MRQIKNVLALLLVTFALPARSESPVDLANPLAGTASLDNQEFIGNAPPPGEEIYTGFTVPGPALPHHDATCGPLNKDLTEAAGNHGIIWPYNHNRRTMLGFTTPAGGVTIMPLVGDWTVPPDRTYASAYDKNSEKAAPGFYTVYFPDHQIKVEMTTTERTAFYRFTFPQTERGVVLLDLGAGDGTVEIAGDKTVRGQSGQGGRGRRGGRCFVAEFSKPFKSFGTFRQNIPTLEGGRVHRDDETNPDSRSESGSYAGSYLNFATAAGEQVLVKMASGRTFEEAQQRLATENPGWDFDAVHQVAADAWSQKLNLVEIKGGSEHDRKFFYSALYHSLTSPRLVVAKGQAWRGRDGQTQTADYNHYSPIAFWDTGRDQVVLLTLLEPELKVDVLRSELDLARESGWMNTSFHGDHAVMMYLGDWERGLKFDYASVYEYLRKNATDPRGPRRNLAEYQQKGWVHDIVVDHPSPPYADGNAGVAKTLEYSWDDHAMALYAKKLSKDDDYQMFLAHAHNYTNVFDATTGFMRGRNEDGSWISPFDPLEPYYNFMMKEANGWQTLWLVPHDVQGLINLLGGREKFCAKMDEFFSTPYHPKGIARDVTGLIGQYCQGNQPDQQSAYFYDWGGQPWKTQKIIRQILRDLYGSDKAGLGYPGMDDQGSTSSWYVLSALGFYTVDPASPDYIIGSPLFDEATIHLGGGKDFTIVAHNNSEQNIYIQSATLNGQSLDRPWFSHAEIANGGKLVFEMGAKPNEKWGSAPAAAPPSLSQ